MERQQTSSTQADTDNDVNFDRKLDIVTAGATPFVKEHLLTKISRENCQTIVNYMLVMQTETSPMQTYRIDTILKLKYFAEFHNGSKIFMNITRQDIIDFLDSLRKPESIDPLHKWVGTREAYRIVFIRFFRWLYAPDIPQRQRPKPAVMENIPKIKRKEVSIYKPTDLWSEEDDFLFYKYCPSSRDRCWHAVARDTACRPHEMLKLKIKDIVVQQLDSGTQIARITVNGKTGTRNVRLHNSYPRLKDWLTNGHPFAGNPNAALFCGNGKKNNGRRLADNAINAMYYRYKNVVFPNVLKDPLAPEENKRKIRDLLKKPWNPYVRRHTAATEISNGLKDPVLVDDYMGWSHKGNTRQKYQHYYTDDAFDAMLMTMNGLVLPSSVEKSRSKNLLKPKMCPNCDESNKPESKFCSKCKFVLSFEAFSEAMEEKGKAAKEVEQQKKALEDRLRRMEEYLDKTNLEVNTLTQTLTKTIAASLSNAGLHVRMKKNNPKESAKKIDDDNKKRRRRMITASPILQEHNQVNDQVSHIRSQ
jgi:integrase/recombinase XerD